MSVDFGELLRPEKHCEHPKLYFGSGEFYIICAECGRFWVAKKHGGSGDVDLDYSAGGRGVVNAFWWRLEK